ncbi:MAG: sigma-70 family RNA polymerase sigma factor [Gemmataceae bacterium]|nr:sigma-70 family RNA polymerase sigma factor [Gemmataceae bacterium]
MTGPITSQLQDHLDRLRRGDSAARQALLQNSWERLRLLTQKMLKSYPGVKRWEETDDVLQNVLLRLDRMLRAIEVNSVRDYFRLAATHIRRELIDLARHYFGPEGLGAQHATPGDRDPTPEGPTPERPARNSAGNLEGWCELHRQISLLPDEEREVFDLLWYQGMSQSDAAQLLQVSIRTVKRRWQSARLALMKALGGDLPF